jgi:hypothetical protein
MFTISLISQRREVTPAAIAGVIRGTLFKEAHYRAALADTSEALPDVPTVGEFVPGSRLSSVGQRPRAFRHVDAPHQVGLLRLAH